VLAVPAARQHVSRQVAKGFRRKLPSVKLRSNQPALWTPYIYSMYVCVCVCIHVCTYVCMHSMAVDAVFVITLRRSLIDKNKRLTTMTIKCNRWAVSTDAARKFVHKKVDVDREKTSKSGNTSTKCFTLTANYSFHKAINLHAALRRKKMLR
jgi:hypothetical protein